MNIFEHATRTKLRFESTKGELSVENLWDLPLTSRTGFDLDTLAKGIARDMRNNQEESFVTTSGASAQMRTLELKLEILKHIIAFKLAEAEKKEQAASKAEEKRRLTEILAQKQDQALLDLTPVELQARLRALG